MLFSKKTILLFCGLQRARARRCLRFGLAVLSMAPALAAPAIVGKPADSSLWVAEYPLSSPF